MSVPLNVRKTLCGEQGRQICLAAVQEDQQHLGTSRAEFWAELSRAGPPLPVGRGWIPV